MDQRTHVITLATPDLHAARSFYVEGLGWRPTSDVPGEILFFQVAPAMLLGLFDSKKFHGDTGSAVIETGVSGVSLAHNVNVPEMVDEVIDSAVAAGAQLVKPPRQAEFGGYHGHFADPNGVLWEVCYNPGLRFDPDGSVHLVEEGGAD